MEDKVDDASRLGIKVDGETRECLALVNARGALAAFVALSAVQQRTYADVSLMELSAFVCWRRVQDQFGSGPKAGGWAAWASLDCEVKAEWVPEDPRSVLGGVPMWAPLLD